MPKILPSTLWSLYVLRHHLGDRLIAYMASESRQGTRRRRRGCRHRHAPFQLTSREGGLRFFRKLCLPSFGTKVEDAKSSSCSRPAFTHLLEMLDTMNDVSFRILVGQVKNVYSASSVSDVDCDVAYLPQAVCTLIEAEQL